jgi:hypothetical protein
MVKSEERDLHPAQGGLAHPGGRALEPSMGGVPIIRARAQRFERPRVYFRFTPDAFILSVAGSDETYRSTPHVAVEQRTRVVKAIGPEAVRHASPDVVVENGFRPDKLVISNMTVAEIAFRYTVELFMERVRRGQLPFLRWMKPDLLIHPLHLESGQLTDVEAQALMDMGRRCPARSVEVYLGPELSDLELRTGYYITAF